MDYLGEHQACSVKLDSPSSVVALHWKPPPQMRYKINVDGTVFGAQKVCGVSVLIRDAEDRVVGAFSKKIKASLRVVEVEAKAIVVEL